MFNKSIVVALVLCACYLGAIQAAGLPLTPVLLTGISGVDTVDQLTQNVPVVGGGSGSGVAGLPGKLPVLGSGGSIIPSLT